MGPTTVERWCLGGILGFLLVLTSCSLFGEPLSWPIDCVPGNTCEAELGFPDVDGDGQAHQCEPAGYRGHEGTDIRAMAGKTDIAVRAAAEGEVLWSFDGKYDACPSSHPDCQAPPEGWFKPGESKGYRVCTPLGPYCKEGRGQCFWCFDGGNVVVIRHHSVPGVFATRYDHMKKGSITVKAGDKVSRGQTLGIVASAGHSTAPHLHFEVWGRTYYDPVDPWRGQCGPNRNKSLWKQEPPWGSG